MGNRSGGCCIFVHNNIESDLTYEAEYELSNFIIVRLIKENLNIACIYRYGQSNINYFVHHIEKNILKYNKMIVVGDININLINDNPETGNYIETVQLNGFIFLNNMKTEFYTRKKNSVGTYIDQVFTNQPQNKHKLSLIDASISDHRMIMLSTMINQSISERETTNNEIRIFDYSILDKNIHKIREIVMEDTFQGFHKKLMELIKENTKIINKNNKIKKGWVTEELLEIIGNRDKLYKLRTRYPDNRRIDQEFKIAKTKARNLTNYLEKKHTGEQIEANINDNRKTW